MLFFFTWGHFRECCCTKCSQAKGNLLSLRARPKGVLEADRLWPCGRGCSQKAVAQSEVHSLSDYLCCLINLHLLVSQVGLLQVSAYSAC